MIITQRAQRAHVAMWYILGPRSNYMQAPLDSKYILYCYMEYLGHGFLILDLASRADGSVGRGCVRIFFTNGVWQIQMHERVEPRLGGLGCGV